MEDFLFSIMFGFLGLFSFGIYKFFNWIAKKIDSRSIWKNNDEESIKGLLQRLYSCNTVETLSKTLEEIKRTYAQYLKIALVVFDECYSSVAFGRPNEMPDERETKVRRRWLIGFALVSLLSIFNLLYFMSTSEEKYNNPYVVEFSVTYLIANFIFSIVIMYRSAYIRKETGWLTCSIIFSVCSLFSLLIKPEIFVETFEYSTGALGRALSIIGLLASFFYLISCVSLRKVNYQLKIRNKLQDLKSQIVSHREDSGEVCL